MEILDIAKQQQNSTDQGQIVEEYSEVFAEIRDFGPKDTNYLRTTRKRAAELDEENAEETRDLIERIVKEKIKRINREVDVERKPGLILFIGNGVPDGHGILLDEEPWVVLDLKTFVERQENYDREIYITHETAHGFHYGNSPSFYFGNDEEPFLEPPIFKMMIAEGMATHLSFLFAPGTVHDAYCFGQYQQEEVERWIYLCEREKSNLGNQIDLDEGVVSPEAVKYLFDIPGNNLEKSRTGYYYGTKIVRSVVEEKDLGTAFDMELPDYKDFIHSYFDL